MLSVELFTEAAVTQAPFEVKLLLSGVVLGALTAIISFTFALTYVPTGELHIAHILSWVVGSYVIVALDEHGLLLAILAATVPLVVIPVACHRVIYAPLMRRRSTVMVFVASFAILTLGQNVIALIFGPKARVLESTWASRNFNLGGINWGVGNFEVLVVVLAGVILAASYLLLRFTDYGRVVEAAGENLTLLGSLGINTGALMVIVYIISGLLLLPVSAYYALSTGVFPTQGWEIFIYGLLAVLIAGNRQPMRAALYAFVIQLVRAVVSMWIPYAYTEATVLCMCGVVLMLFPGGISLEGGMALRGWLRWALAGASRTRRTTSS